MSNIKKSLHQSARLTLWIKYVLYCQILIAALAIILGLAEYQSLAAYKAGYYNTLTDAFNDAKMALDLLQIVGFLSLLAFISSALLILPWIYKANANARQQGSLAMRYTPIWSIAYYIIPIFNLWKPYQAMKEIWLSSLSNYPTSNDKIKDNSASKLLSKSAYILPLWWTLWIASNLVGQAVFRLSANVQSLSELVNLNLLSQVSNVLDIPLALVTLIMISSIQKRQSRY